MLVALFDSQLLCSPPSNRATKRLACVGFVWQADTGDEYDIIITTTTATTATATATATATPTATATAAAATTTTSSTTTTTTTTTTRSINSTRFRALCALCASAFCAGSARVVLRGFRACSRIQIS